MNPDVADHLRVYAEAGYTIRERKRGGQRVARDERPWCCNRRMIHRGSGCGDARWAWRCVRCGLRIYNLRPSEAAERNRGGDGP